ncbi:unnamed protein product [Cylindrotheca closterium]|uniref:NADP-dependent oxidoreductase domain-containing protein n=1 Tax=Cylindrotheca closterium TaxID=2856 RepID=A0AAD2G3Y7_9STRA|nr:unnamed protein product [Cylindrotheca closterium]
MVDENSFNMAPAASTKIITTKKGKQAKVEYKDFWGSTISTIDPYKERPPCVPTLDPFWGPLPKAAYECEADEIWDPKPTCEIAVDLAPITNNEREIKVVQNYLESGFQTFHGATPEFIERFHAQTPTKLIGKGSIHWVLQYKVPTKVTSLHSVRHDILDNLLEHMSSCTDAIDTLVVQYNRFSPYHMDVLYALTELQEEGYIRSIGLENFPPKLVAQAASECRFSVSLMQQPGSLLLPPDSMNSPIQHQWITNPFLDGLLLGEAANTRDGKIRKSSKKKKDKQHQRTTPSNNTSERIQTPSPKQERVWQSTLQKWAKLHGIASTRDEEGKEIYDSTLIWETFDTNVMEVLQEMSSRYGVSLKALVLRWTLELDDVSSVVIPAPKGQIWDDMDFTSSRKWKVHIQELREAFTFRIDEEDKATLTEMSKQRETEEDQGSMMDLGELEEFLVKQGLPENEIEALLDEQQQQQSSSSSKNTDYPKINFDNPRLWL